MHKKVSYIYEELPEREALFQGLASRSRDGGAEALDDVPVKSRARSDASKKSGDDSQSATQDRQDQAA